MNHDHNAADRAALAAWRTEQARQRLDRLHAQRPPAFDATGTLHPDITAWCDRYIAGDRGPLVLIGGVGVGKSWSTWAAAEYLITRHNWRGGFAFARAYDFQRAAAPPVDDALLTQWKNVDLLALDDLGAQRVSEWDAGHLAGIINDRSEHRRPFIITSNDGDLKTVLGARSASRTRDNATLVHMLGDDRRKARQ